jgi:hypothetical protein
MLAHREFRGIRPGDVVGQRNESLNEALTAAQAWLSAGSAARYGSPPVSPVIYQTDARGYDCIVMDLLVA